MKENWIWMPHPGHFIGAHDCKFHLNTYLGNGYSVSTIGEYWPDSEVRKIYAKCRRIEIEGRGDDWDRDYMKKIGFEDIGFNRKYETMVFPAAKTKDDSCCSYRINPSAEMATKGYNDPKAAYEGHMKMCEEWDKKTQEEET